MQYFKLYYRTDYTNRAFIFFLFYCARSCYKQLSFLIGQSPVTLHDEILLSGITVLPVKPFHSKLIKRTKMMRTRVIFLLASTSLLTLCQAQELSLDDMELVARTTDFAFSLYRKIASTSDDNIFLSPLTAAASLAALSGGTQSTTRTELLEGLALSSLEQDGQASRIPELFQKLDDILTQDGAFQSDRAIAFFLSQKVEVQKVFSDQFKKFFKADLPEVDFSNPEASKFTINQYIRTQTRGKVASDVGNIDPETQLMLINTIFFQVKWDLPFNSSFTQEERFYVNKYNIAQVPMMFRADKYYLAYDRSLKLGVLKLPCQGKVAMLVLLPDKDVDYTAIDEELTPERFRGWVKQLKKTKLEVQLPRFKLERSYSMQKILPDLGIVDIFENKADLSALSKEARLKVSQVLLKGGIEADEKGLSNSATMASSITEVSMPPRLTINRPFLFLIYHEVTNSLLFMGRVIDPTKN
uniref:Protein Z-dependent protease inhibitor-like n=1 Tax=Scleropages formosus TaxID=113540 RepID=A0A8C9RV69_SCLFO